MLDRGKLAVLGLLAVGLVAAGFAWWWNFQHGRKCLEFYGSEAALLIRTAPRVELLELAASTDNKATSNADLLQLGEQSFRIVRQLDISKAPGLIHARTALVDDASYRWGEKPAACPPQIQYAVRFSDRSSVTLAFDFACERVRRAERGGQAVLIPKVAAGWKSFLARQAGSNADQP
jgi:hypothetical protein